jgi:hypothetical protein
VSWNGKMTASTRHPAEHAMRHEREGNKFPGFSPSRSVRLASCSVSKRRHAHGPIAQTPLKQGLLGHLHAPKKLRPAFGGRLAAREPVWDGEGWGCDRVAGSIFL